MTFLTHSTLGLGLRFESFFGFTNAIAPHNKRFLDQTWTKIVSDRDLSDAFAWLSQLRISYTESGNRLVPFEN